jgi:cytochrome c oxidase subunit 2
MNAGSLVTLLQTAATHGLWEKHESMLNPGSSATRHVLSLWWWMFAVSCIVWIAVTGYTLYAVIRGTHAARAANHGTAYGTTDHSANDETRDAARQERIMRRAVSIATALTILILVVHLVYNFGVDRAVAAPPHAESALHVNIVGHQWWWEITYDDTNPQRQVTTANEIHIPTNRTVIFHLASRDVIHSFWVPNLSGKKDLIPGHDNSAWLRADTPGVYRGQCAEFCGHEHAKMAILVIAQPPAQFAAWYEAQLRPRVPPTDSLAQAGERLFLSKSCAMCHTIEGTGAAARAGPTLTHIASRRTLGAGLIPLTHDNLTQWVRDPQRIKPGIQMPIPSLSPEELRALVAYLERLQ